jgi:hypothetical protein
MVWEIYRVSTGPAIALAKGKRIMVSLIFSLIHVRIPTSTTVYCQALSRLNKRVWSTLDGQPSS